MNKLFLNAYIIADPEICHGKPTFKGTRIMVSQVLDMLAGGESQEEILEDFPSLTHAHIQAALQYAAKLTEGKQFISFDHEIIGG